MNLNSLFFVIAAALGSLTAHTALAAQTFPTDLPTFACEIKPLTRDGLKTARANRERFAKACLAVLGMNAPCVSGLPDLKTERPCAEIRFACLRRSSE